jgi:hypothetical protein
MRAIDMAGWIALLVATLAAGAVVPLEGWSDFAAPATGGVLAYPVALVALGILRARGALRGERMLLAGFLASMPLVYVRGALLVGQGLGIELVGLAIFAAVAWLGLQRPMLLAVGIALHGVGWDSWHTRYDSGIPAWYAWACLIVDVGVALYAATRAHAAR